MRGWDAQRRQKQGGRPAAAQVGHWEMTREKGRSKGCIKRVGDGGKWGGARPIETQCSSREAAAFAAATCVGKKIWGGKSTRGAFVVGAWYGGLLVWVLCVCWRDRLGLLVGVGVRWARGGGGAKEACGEAQVALKQNCRTGRVNNGKKGETSIMVQVEWEHVFVGRKGGVWGLPSGGTRWMGCLEAWKVCHSWPCGSYGHRCRQCRRRLTAGPQPGWAAAEQEREQGRVWCEGTV